jgi:hypothetical protein
MTVAFLRTFHRPTFFHVLTIMQVLIIAYFFVEIFVLQTRELMASKCKILIRQKITKQIQSYYANSKHANILSKNQQIQTIKFSFQRNSKRFHFYDFRLMPKFNNTQTNSNLIGYTDFYFSVSVKFSDPYIIIIIIRVKVL